MTSDDLTAVLCAFFIALGLPLVLRPLLTRAGVVDVPNERSSHTTTVLRGGGLAQVGGTGVGLILAALVSTATDQKLLWLILGVALSSAALGWIEDVRGVAIAVRACCQFLIGLAATLVGMLVTEEPLWWGFLGGLAVLGLINVVNFMDGINSISSFHGVIAGLSFVAIGSQRDAHWLIISGAILTAAFLAFLPWNVSGRLFLGDVGSYLLGGTVAIVITLGWMSGLSIVALASPFSIYVADTGITLISRIMTGEKWQESHRDHTYQLLSQAGMSHLSVSFTVACLSTACAALGFGASESSGWLSATYLVAIASIVAGYTVIRFRLKSRYPEQIPKAARGE